MRFKRLERLGKGAKAETLSYVFVRGRGTYLYRFLLIEDNS